MTAPNSIHDDAFWDQVPAEFLRTLVEQGREVYVHCVAAENRTPTVAAAWLCRHHGADPGEALALAAVRLNAPKPFLRRAVERLG